MWLGMVEYKTSTRGCYGRDISSIASTFIKTERVFLSLKTHVFSFFKKLKIN